MPKGHVKRPTSEESGRSSWHRGKTGKNSTPVTPKMLIKALEKLKKKSFKSIFFTPKEVAFEIMRKYTSVQQDVEILLMEVGDKLLCASAAGLIGVKQDAGYYALDLRQEAFRADTKSELMFWLFYKKILNRRREQRRRVLAERRESNVRRNISTKFCTQRFTPISDCSH
ncbi:hypothetical protein RUM43_010945 [Polyplax serrata]|uniref:Uncharacterized protein n=1 Tax=Polyplax serrata TaxID=468196 RepID=A0AAN8NL90_POLSC